MGRIRTRGTKLYFSFVDADGTERTRLARGCTAGTLKGEKQAKALLTEAERRAQAGEMGVPEKPTEEQRQRGKITVLELVERFVKEYARPTLHDPDAYRRAARSKLKKRIKPLLGHRVAATLTLSDIEVFRDALAEPPFKLAPASITRTLAVVSKAYNWARRASVLACANPVQGVERPRAASSLDYLSADEVDALLRRAELLAGRPCVASHVGMMLWPMAATAVHTGLRLGELHGLTWSALHLDTKQLDVLHSYALAPKSGEKRHVPINAELVPVLEAWKKRCPETPEGLVFPVQGRKTFRMGDARSLSGVLQALLKGAGCHVPEKPWHALRHTFASHAVMSGVPLYTVQQLLGHSTPTMTQRYAHLAPDHLAEAIDRISFRAPMAITPSRPSTHTAAFVVRRRRSAAAARRRR
jgi:integrase